MHDENIPIYIGKLRTIRLEIGLQIREIVQIGIDMGLVRAGTDNEPIVTASMLGEAEHGFRLTDRTAVTLAKIYNRIVSRGAPNTHPPYNAELLIAWSRADAREYALRYPDRVEAIKAKKRQNLERYIQQKKQQQEEASRQQQEEASMCGG